MHIITIANDSSCTGQSTAVAMLAECFSSLGYRTLVCDLSSDITSGLLKTKPQKTIWDLYFDQRNVTSIILPYRGFGILPLAYEDLHKIASLCHAATEVISWNPITICDPEWAYVMRSILQAEELQKQYEVCLVDASRCYGIVLTTALHAADTVLVPLSDGPFSASGAASVISKVCAISLRAGHAIDLETFRINLRPSRLDFESKDLDRLAHKISYHYEACIPYSKYAPRILAGKSLWNYTKLAQGVQHLALEIAYRHCLKPRIAGNEL